jgi:hypothetical protein
MTEQKYSVKEALNRIARLLMGNIPASDVPGTVTGPDVSENRAFSVIAELLARSMPDEFTHLPWAEYGQIYGVSGSVMGLENTQWELITFSDDGASSPRVVPNSAADGVTINDAGCYFVDFQISYVLDVARRLNFRAEWNLTGQDQIRTRDSAITGSYRQVSGAGFIDNIVADPANSNDVQLYVWSENGTGTLTILDAQLNVRKVY